MDARERRRSCLDPRDPTIVITTTYKRRDHRARERNHLIRLVLFHVLDYVTICCELWTLCSSLSLSLSYTYINTHKRFVLRYKLINFSPRRMRIRDRSERVGSLMKIRATTRVQVR